MSINQEDEEEKGAYQARKQCIKNLGGRWSLVEQNEIDCVHLNLGHSNRLYKCTLDGYSVIVRFYGSYLTGEGNKYKTLSESCEAVIVQKLGELKLGPPILVFFEGGRIEKYLPSRSLTYEEYKDERFAQVLARKLALVHHLQMPVPKRKPNFLLDQMHQLCQTIENSVQLQTIPDSIRQKYGQKIDALIDFDFESMIDTIDLYHQQLQSRIVFTHNDLNKTNILLLEEPLRDTATRMNSTKYHHSEMSLDDHLLIMDFEYCSYGYRWADMATYFQELAFDPQVTKDKNRFKSIQEAYPNERFRKLFFQNYLQILRQQEVTTFDSNIDNVHQLEQECQFGSLCVNLIRVLWTLAHPSINDDQLGLWEISYYRLQMLIAQHDQFFVKHN